MPLLTTITRAVGRLTDMLPMTIGARLKRGRFRYDPADIPPPLEVPIAPIRVLIAPANSAAQGWSFARALEGLNGVAARNFHIVPKKDFGFPADGRITSDLSSVSAPWQRRHFAAVRQFSHVIVESGRPQFARLFDADTMREIDALRRAGVEIAVLAHGSDLRDPDRHRALDEWSPFHEESWELIPKLRLGSLMFRSMLDRAGVPVFVTTPDLLLDRPDAQWTPLVVELERWATDAPVLERERPVVVHAPTNTIIKGTHLIEPTLLRLQEEGLIEYRRLEGVPSDRMPALFAESDIVIDQMRIGSYSAVSVEAMMAGRLVIAHLHEHTRETVRATTGADIPVMEATPRSLESRLRAAIADRAGSRALAAQGPRFVREVHDGGFTARVIEREFLRRA